MKDWQALLAAQRYGAGMVLVLSLGLRVVPKVLLAPLAGGLLRRFGRARVASGAMLATAVLTALLPWNRNLILLQVLTGGIGTPDMFIMPGLLSMRSSVTPDGLSMASNTACSVADRIGKVAGPALGGLLITLGFMPAFTIFALMIALSAIPVARLSAPTETPPTETPPTETPRTCAGAQPRTGSLTGLLRLISTDWQIIGLLVAAFTYMIQVGGLRPFLFWANRDWFGASDTAWTGLLAAPGAGALIGALVSGLFVSRLLRHMTPYTLAMLTGILESAMHLLLVFAETSAQAIIILTLIGIPEIICNAAWFTTLQVRLPAAQQAVFFTVITPLWDLFFAIGIASAGLHAQGVLSLSGYWVLISLIATLPLLPLLATGRKSPR